MQVVVLAGGLGTRLVPVTETIPKVMIELDGIPFIHYQLSRLLSAGFSKFVFCLGYLSEIVIKHIDSLEEWRHFITFSVEEEALGTGGALLNALPLLEEDFMVINGDNIWMGDYPSAVDYYSTISSKVLVLLRNRMKGGNVIFEPASSKITRYSRDCPSCNAEDIGIKVLKKSKLEEFQGNYPLSLEDDIYQSLISDGDLDGLMTDGAILDIGTFEEIEKTGEFLSGLRNRGIFQSNFPNL